MMLFRVQQMSQPSAAAGSSGDAALIMALLVVSVLIAAAYLFVGEVRQHRSGGAAILVSETERWLREQAPGR